MKFRWTNGPALFFACSWWKWWSLEATRSAAACMQCSFASFVVIVCHCIIVHFHFIVLHQQKNIKKNSPRPCLCETRTEMLLGNPKTNSTSHRVLWWLAGWLRRILFDSSTYFDSWLAGWFHQVPGTQGQEHTWTRFVKFAQTQATLAFVRCKIWNCFLSSWNVTARWVAR